MMNHSVIYRKTYFSLVRCRELKINYDICTNSIKRQIG
jgi:hypothetical protein